MIVHDGATLCVGRGVMKFFRTFGFCAAIVGWALTGAASAEQVAAVTGDQLQRVLEEAGLSPTMLEDAVTGAPVVNGRAGETSFIVRALSCSGTPSACSDLIFFANFNLGRAAHAGDFRNVNKFNDSQVFGRAYVLESQNQVGVDYVIELGGGVNEAHLTQNVSRWADVIAAFVQSFTENNTGT